MNYRIVLLLLSITVLMPTSDIFANNDHSKTQKELSQQAQNNSLPARSVAKFPQPRRRFQVIIPTKDPREISKAEQLKASLKSDRRRQSASDTGGAKKKSRRANLQRFHKDIIRIAKKHRLDPTLIRAVISVESAFNPDAVSHKGAMGLMQLMPATARRFGARNPFDPLINIDAGSRYLRWLLEEFGDVRLALAAYNAGEGAVMRYGNTIPPYRETRRYVVKVLDHYDRYSNQYLIE